MQSSKQVENEKTKLVTQVQRVISELKGDSGLKTVL